MKRHDLCVVIYVAPTMEEAAHDTREGTDFARVQIIEFPSYEQAVACYDDPEYCETMKHEIAAYGPEQPRELVIVEGN